MPKTRPPYPAEFRQQMIELVRAGGKTPAQLSREFECTAQTIINWVAQAARDEGGPLPGKEGLSSAEREELARLRRQVRQLQMERDILAKGRSWACWARGYHLTQMKVRDLLAQLLGVDFSVGAISQAHAKVATALKAPVGQAVQSLAAAPVAHMDETRYPREGAGNWAWAVVQPKLAVFNLMPSRARYVIHGLIGEEPQAVVVSDRYAAYAHIPAEQRQLCWAHLLRDFARIAERQGTPGRIGAKLLGAGHVLFRWRQADRPAAAFEPVQRRIRRALEQGAAQTLCRRTAATCEHLALVLDLAVDLPAPP